jgi:hypothetical protein
MGEKSGKKFRKVKPGKVLSGKKDKRGRKIGKWEER